MLRRKMLSSNQGVLKVVRVFKKGDQVYREDQLTNFLTRKEIL